MTKYTQLQLFNPGKASYLKQIDSHLSDKIKPGHVRISVNYSGLNFADIMMSLGLYPDAPKAPFCPGYEISGTIDSIGPNCDSTFEVGQKVMAGSYFNGQSNFIDVPVWQVYQIPEGFDLELAAALPVSGLTCDLALGQLARVRADDEVMIDCGSGALGAMMISYLKNHGVKNIIGLTSNDEKLVTIKERGAEALSLGQWRKGSRKVDIIINSRGGKSLHLDRLHLKPLGRVIALGASHMVSRGGLSYLNVFKEFLGMKKIGAIELMHANQGVFGLNVLRLFETPEVLRRSFIHINELASKGVLTPVVDKVFHYRDVEAAYDYLARGLSKGKVLISWENL